LRNKSSQVHLANSKTKAGERVSGNFTQHHRISSEKVSREPSPNRQREQILSLIHALARLTKPIMISLSAAAFRDVMKGSLQRLDVYLFFENQAFSWDSSAVRLSRDSSTKAPRAVN
jgi:hypothetical protein